MRNSTTSPLHTQKPRNGAPQSRLVQFLESPPAETSTVPRELTHVGGQAGNAHARGSEGEALAPRHGACTSLARGRDTERTWRRCHLCIGLQDITWLLRFRFDHHLRRSVDQAQCLRHRPLKHRPRRTELRAIPRGQHLPGLERRPRMQRPERVPLRSVRHGLHARIRLHPSVAFRFHLLVGGPITVGLA